MQFGVQGGAKIDAVDTIVLAEQLGYASAWVGDSQMVWSDCYATLALAATRTSRIHLGTGVAAAGTRIAPVTAHSIATINRLAPGRTFLGLGTGDTSMRAMGQVSMKLGAFQRYARTVRDLLDGESTPFTYDSQTRDVRFLHATQGYIQLEPRIPIYIAAQGPATQRFAGAFGDGVDTSAAINPVVCRAIVANVRGAAAQTGRELPADFHVSAGASVLVLTEGECLDSERAVHETGVTVLGWLQRAWNRMPEPRRDLARAPEPFRDVWLEFCDYVDAIEPERRYQRLYVGYGAFLPDELARFVTPGAIRTCTIAGTPPEIVARLQELAAAGLTEFRVYAPPEYGPKAITDFAEQVIPHFAPSAR